MAGTDRAAATSLAEGLAKEPFRYGFFSVLRRLECAFSDRPRLGAAPRAVGEPVRLTQEPSLVFAPSTLASYAPGVEGASARLAVFFFGLFGPNGPLPLHLTEYARDRLRNHGDPTFARFADIFHHRLLAFFYRAWADAQPTVAFDRPETDRFARYVGAFLGVGQPSLRDRDAVPDLAKLHNAGLLASHTRNADGLHSLLESYFEMPVVIEQFVGQWVELPEGARWRLGHSPESGCLGRTTVAGARVWSCQQKFRIVFGPLEYADYRRLLPGSDSLARLTALVRTYVGDELAWDVRVILKREAVPPLVLGRDARLGLTTWCGSLPAGEVVGDLYLDPLAAVA